MILPTNKNRPKLDESHVFNLPSNFNFSRDIISEWGRWEDKLAIIFKDINQHRCKSVSYNELSNGACLFSELTIDLGFHSDDITYVIGEVSYHWICIVIELIKRRVIFSPTSSTITEDAIIKEVNLINAKSILLTEDLDLNFDFIMKNCIGVKHIYKLDKRKKITLFKKQSNHQLNENVWPYIPENTMMVEFYLDHHNFLGYKFRDNTYLLDTKSSLENAIYKSPKTFLFEDGLYKTVNWKHIFFQFVRGALVNIMQDSCK